MREIHCPKCKTRFEFEGSNTQKLECSVCHYVFTVKEAKEEMLAMEKKAHEEVVCSVVLFGLALIVFIAISVYG